MARDCQAPVLHQQAPGNVTLLDGVWELMANHGYPSAPGYNWGTQVVPDTDMRLRDAWPQTAPVNDGATALRDRCLTEYEARLNHSEARPTATTENGDERSDPMAATGSGILRGARQGYLLHPQCASWPSRLPANVTDSPWARHQQRAQNKTSTRPADAVYGDAHYRERGLEQEGTVPCQQFAPRQRYLETSDDASEEDTQHPEFVPLPRGMDTQPQPPRHGDIDHRGERHSRRD